MFGALGSKRRRKQPRLSARTPRDGKLGGFKYLFCNFSTVSVRSSSGHMREQCGFFQITDLTLESGLKGQRGVTPPSRGGDTVFIDGCAERRRHMALTTIKLA